LPTTLFERRAQRGFGGLVGEVSNVQLRAHSILTCL
jgi:hypothetical protein